MVKRRRTQIISVFVDSSVLFTAVNSPTGGSAKLFSLKKIKFVTSPVVLTEVERNVRIKLQTYHLDRFFQLASIIAILEQNPDDKIIAKAKKIIAEKDCIILAEAKQAKSDILVTLDKKHFLQEKVIKFLSPQKILTPKMLLEKLKGAY